MLFDFRFSKDFILQLVARGVHYPHLFISVSRASNLLTYLPVPSIRTLLSVSPTRVCLVHPVTSSIFPSLVPLFSFRDYPWVQGLSDWLRSLSWQYLVWFVSDLCAGMKQLIGKLNDLWPEHSVALSIPKEVDRSKEKLEGAWETTGV